MWAGAWHPGLGGWLKGRYETNGWDAGQLSLVDKVKTMLACWGAMPLVAGTG